MKKLCRFSRALGSGILITCWIVLLFNAGCAMYNQEQPFQADYKLQQQMDKKGKEERQTQKQAPPAQAKQKQSQSAGQSSAPKQGKPNKIKVDHDTANRSKLIATSVEGVTDAAAVAIDQELSVAVAVAQMKRFQLKGIRKEIFHRLRKAYPEYQVHVSTDRKILQELKKLEKKTYQQQTEAEKKRLQKINQDMKG
ncbi:YhcN/YlaJ family sporulation lipoprotein [Caldalkalibacillus thermarum TA2.A1]|uniref:YhcN/YlaJ family sporulation lipoprotein n=1 Tax=Caldalkalibacillus thermarum (strain TA2.A1) TaxID=986075 RepID=A0A8X8IBZ4_CALTT|nr:YhcN/YlaJ family sporulation lipoprotein [Caldalkalibacillus thermarum]QZT34901.1 YhcN/YlaJ family sporulation lipoprotein [Caldalkalibacillus thermarum TA2.A1]